MAGAPRASWACRGRDRAGPGGPRSYLLSSAGEGCGRPLLFEAVGFASCSLASCSAGSGLPWLAPTHPREQDTT